MQLKASYIHIWQLAYPIIVGSFAQNLIGVTDIIFLARVGETEFGAAGIISIYYLALVMVGFGISRGGQVLIARRAGQQNYKAIGKITYNLFYVEMLVAFVLWFFLLFLSPFVLYQFIHSTEIYNASLEYIKYRAYGLPFSFLGFVVMALYTSIGRTKVIAYVTIILFFSNVCLNYSLIFGKFGLPVMGIGGAGLASTIAEIIAAIFGMIYIYKDKALRKYDLFKLHAWQTSLIKQITNLSYPIVFQYIISMGGWFLLFSLIESMGKRALSISTVIKNVYTFYSIPAWGFASAANSLVSNLIGQQKHHEVSTAIHRTAVLSFLFTFFTCLTLMLFPETIIAIFTSDESIVKESKTILFMLIAILLGGSISLIIFNGLMGTGAMLFALLTEVFSVVVYLLYAYASIRLLHLELSYVWASEFLYWVALAIPAWFYLYSERWKTLKV
ncbi:MAG: MATE family efflux transporter [Chitinophagales bacterium]